jgi:UDP-N-acetylglucosamine 2-epimerase
MLEGLEAMMLKQRPDCVIVYGDTNSTLAGALAASKLGIPVAHVEAGLRSYDRSMPEEINRVVTDHVATYLFCPTANAVACLRKEGLERGVYEVGDLMYDSVQATLQRAEAYAPEVLQRCGLTAGEYYLVTIHRASNTDDPSVLRDLFMALGKLKAPVFLPLHPRTREAIEHEGVPVAMNVRLAAPTGYLDMLALESNARAILTDSGGIQREAYFLSVPCVTLREETEWPETLAGGWNALAGCDQSRIVRAAERPRPSESPQSAFGDGQAAAKIVEILERDPPHR